MSQPDKTILIANAIFATDESKQLRCYLCEETPSCKDWPVHIETRSHAIRLKSFKTSFVNRSDSFGCKICAKNIDRRALKSHAVEHEITPWYRPVDLYKKFFENQTLEWLGKFYCYPCDEIFLNWSMAFIHSKNERHEKKLKSSEPKNNKYHDLTKFGLNYKCLIRDGVFSSGDRSNIDCKICDCPNIGIKNFDQHIRGIRHSDEKFKLNGLLRDRAKLKMADERMIDNRIKMIEGKNYWCDFCKCHVGDPEQVSLHLETNDHRSKRWKLRANCVIESKIVNEPMRREITEKPLDGATINGNSKFCDYIVEQMDKKFCCKICDLTSIDQLDIDAHVMSYEHETGWKKFRDNDITFKEGNEYYCGFCKCNVPGIRNVCLHIDGNRHVNSRHDKTAINEESIIKIQPISREITKKQQPTDGAVSEQRFFSSDFIVKLSDNDAYCTICKCKTNNKFDNETHASCKRHVTRVKKFHDSGISMRENNCFNCDSCNLEINDCNDVFRHIDAVTHKLKLLALTEIVDESKIGEPSIESLTKVPIAGGAIIFDQRSLSRDLIVRRSVDDYYCAICDRTIVERNNVRDHVSNKSHATCREKFCDNKITFRDDKYYCDYCSCKIFPLDNVLLHLSDKGHIIARSKHLENSVNEKMSKGTTVMKAKLPYHYIVESNEIEAYCKICGCSIGDYVRIEEHVAGYRHVRALGIFKANKIEFKEKDVYHCEYCNCKIFGKFNVDKHIKGTRHLSAVNRSKETIDPGPEVSRTKDPSLVIPKTKVPKSENLKDIKLGDPVPKDLKPKNFNDVKSENPKMVDLKPKVPEPKILEPKNLKPEVSKPKNPESKHPNQKDPKNTSLALHSLPSPRDDEYGHNIAKSKNQELSKSEKITDSSIATGKKLPYRYIVEFDENHAFCKICDCSIGGYVNIEQHVAGFRHASAMEIFNENKIEFWKNDIYKCNYCNCKIYSYFNVQPHIKGNRHVSALIKSKEPKPKDPVSKNSEPKDPKLKDPKLNVPKPNVPKPKNSAKQSSQNVSHEYLVKINYTDSLCKICDCVIHQGQRNVDEHLAGRGHAAALRKYGCENISLVVAATRDYYCKSCDCRVCGDGQIWRHALSKNHAKSIINDSKEPAGDNKNSNPSNSYARSRLLISSMKHEKSSNPSRLSAGTGKNSRSKFMRMIWEEQIRNTAKPVICSMCGDELANAVEFHGHLAGHLSNYFQNSNDDRRNYCDTEKSRENKIIITKPLNVSTESIYTLASEGEHFDLSEIPGTQLMKYIEPGTLERSAKKPNIDRIMKTLNFSNDDIYSMSEKLRELELGLKLSYVKISQKVYCLVCRATTDYTIEDYYQHLCSLDHCIYLERMERDDERFDQYPEQFSEIDLGFEYMEEISKNLVLCHVCDVKISASDDDILRQHIDEESHASERCTMRDLTMKSFDRVALSMRCDWYKVQRYYCVPCITSFGSEVNFVKHMDSKDHLYSMERPINKKRQLIYDFCEACSLLWYGYRRTCAYHRDIDTHLWLIRDGYYLSTELPKKARELLAMPECYIDERIKTWEASKVEERSKEEMLIRDMEMAVGRKYCRAKAYIFGSRVTGVGSWDCDIDVFLDCDDMYDGKMESRDLILNTMDGVCECLNQEPQLWVIEELVKTCRSPIIRAHHRPTGLSCDISFENGLGVENTNLIKSYNDAYPLCREMIIFLKRWLTLCKLSGSERITSYALYWHVIFYLQNETILPSVEELIKIKNQSRIINGWEVGASRDMTCKIANDNFTIRQLLSGFFRFWCNFDHRYDVACPMIGKILKKRFFICNTKIFDYTSSSYDEKRVWKSMIREAMRIDSPMCVQDPLDLCHNITKAVGKVYVNRFRKYCSYSLDVLCT